MVTLPVAVIVMAAPAETGSTEPLMVMSPLVAVNVAARPLVRLEPVMVIPVPFRALVVPDVRSAPVMLSVPEEATFKVEAAFTTLAAASAAFPVVVMLIPPRVLFS